MPASIERAARLEGRWEQRLAHPMHDLPPFTAALDELRRHFDTWRSSVAQSSATGHGANRQREVRTMTGIRTGNGSDPRSVGHVRQVSRPFNHVMTSSKRNSESWRARSAFSRTCWSPVTSSGCSMHRAL